MHRGCGGTTMSSVGNFCSRPSLDNTTPQTQFASVFEGSLIRASRQASLTELAVALRAQEMSLRLTRNETDYEIELARWCDLRMQLLSETNSSKPLGYATDVHASSDALRLQPSVALFSRG
jgi:hypothetical protein